MWRRLERLMWSYESPQYSRIRESALSDKIIPHIGISEQSFDEANSYELLGGQTNHPAVDTYHYFSVCQMELQPHLKRERITVSIFVR